VAVLVRVAVQLLADLAVDFVAQLGPQDADADDEVQLLQVGGRALLQERVAARRLLQAAAVVAAVAQLVRHFLRQLGALLQRQTHQLLLHTLALHLGVFYCRFRSS